MPNPENIKGQGFHTNPERINRKGAPKKIPALDILLAELYGEDDKGKTEAREIIQALDKEARKGNVRAAEVLLERIYGKVTQSIQHKGDPENPILFQLDDRFKNSD